jgi:hypothetical protein
LFTSRWFRTQKGELLDGPNDPYIEQYYISGIIEHDEGEAPDAAAFPLSSPFEPILTNPIDSMVNMHLSQNVYVPDVPHAYVRLRWNPASPTLPPTEAAMVNIDRVNYKERNRLWKVGMRLYDDSVRGRKKGTGRFASAADFEQAVFSAVAALSKRRQRATQETIGRLIIGRRGRNRVASDAPADPGRQFRDWCDYFRIKPKDLIQRAIAACACEE